ncbi:MAG: glycosyltransferase family 1 protein [Ignavibacteriaceae bacterium]|nr:glycosyltransferase family 1 protein [Ignavibacteriaceae bacterium]
MRKEIYKECCIKIAYFNASFKIGQDGVTRVLYKMIQGALERNHEVIGITSVLPEQEEQIIPMYQVPSVVMPLQKNYRLALPGYHAFAKVLEKFNPDILHINSPCPLGYSAMKYGQFFNIPVVATYHTHFPKYLPYYHLSALEEWTWKLSRSLYNNIDRTFVPTRPIMDELTQHNFHELEYLPNGVDGVLFNPNRRSSAWRKQFSNGEKPIVLFVSRLVWEKDLHVLAEAYKVLHPKRNDFEMIVVGDGPARKEFQAMMSGAHFLGYQSGETLAEIFASADIFAFPSTTETFGLVTLEAMASGLVPVAVNVGGAVDIIEDGKSGFFSSAESGKDMAEKIAFLLDNPGQRKVMSKNAHARSSAFHWENIFEQLFSSYRELLNIYRQHRTSHDAA